MDVERIKQEANGRWREILQHVGGLSPEMLDDKGRPCPKCGGTDRFSVFKDFDETGGMICRKCFDKGADGLAAVQWILGVDFQEAIRLVAEYLRLDNRPQLSGATPKASKPKASGESFPTLITALGALEATRGKPAAVWKYKSEDGEIVGAVCRWNKTNGGKDILPLALFPDGWRMKAMLSPRPMYRLPEIVAGEGRVLIVEGEKACDELRTLGLSVTTSAGGASAPHKTNWIPLAGREVVIVPDHDEPGRKYAETVGSALFSLSPPAQVKIVPLEELYPEAKVKDDVHDWMMARDSIDPNDLREQLESLVDSVPAYIPDAAEVVQADEEWPEPEPLAFDLPTFPEDCLPARLALWAEAEAEATQTPLDMSAMLGLAAVAVAAAKRVRIEGSPGWTEPVNIYSVCVLAPGNRKSAVFRDASRPLLEWEKEEAERLNPEILKDRTMRQVSEKHRGDLVRKAANAEPSERAGIIAELCEVDLELSEPAIVARRLFTSDSTPEKLEPLMAENGERMGVLSDEGGIFSIMMGRYQTSGAPNIDIFLKAHDGGALRVDRLGRDSVAMDAPALTLGLSVQPDVLAGLGDSRQLRGRGLLGRILFSIPRSPVGRRKVNPQPMPEQIREDYESMIRELCDYEGEPVSLTLDGEAKGEFSDFRKHLEPMLSQSGDYGDIVDWASKLPGEVLRVAGLIHIGDNGIQTGEITEETIRSAIKIGWYLMGHARAALDLIEGIGETSAAEAVLEKIKERGEATFTRRDLFNSIRGQRRFAQASALKEPLAVLEQRGHIRRKSVDSHKQGRPSEAWEVNSSIVAEFTDQFLGIHAQYTQNPP